MKPIVLFCFLLVALLEQPVWSQSPLHQAHGLESIQSSFRNPAGTGNENFLSTTFYYRSQWTGSLTNIQSLGLILDTPIGDSLHNAGMQFGLVSEGPLSITSFLGNYAMRIPMNPDHSLAFGLRGGLHVANLDYDRFNSPDRLNPIDPAYPTRTMVIPAVGFGVEYTSPSMQIGISFPDLLLRNQPLAPRSQIFAFAQWTFPITYDWKLISVLNTRSKLGYNLMTDLYSGLSFRRLFQASILLRREWMSSGVEQSLLHGLGGLFKLRLSNQVSFTYHYDLGLELSAYTNRGGSHEMFINYQFKF